MKNLMALKKRANYVAITFLRSWLSTTNTISGKPIADHLDQKQHQ